VRRGVSDRVAELMARRPQAELEVALPKAVKVEFWEQGFSKIDRITTDEEVEWIREVYDALFGPEAPMPLIRDVMVSIDAQRGDRVSQIIRPEHRYPELKDTTFWKNSRKLAAKILDLDRTEMEGWGHMVRKAPFDDESLPWHQDEGYWDPSFSYRALGVWMPLDPATQESGCMTMIPGSHRGHVLKLKAINDDPNVTALEPAEAVPVEKAVFHPIEIGGASFHHCRTLHASGPNLTGRPRRATVIEWQRTPVKREEADDRGWYWERQRVLEHHLKVTAQVEA
jgi:ectoine hydroxylase-related dioxygenase (phytanoyl-CoA dioxygenase family)